MACFEVVESRSTRCLHCEGQLASALHAAVKKDLEVALGGVQCRANNLVVDDFDHVKAQSRLDQLLVGFRVDAAGHHHAHLLLEGQATPRTPEVRRSDHLRVVGLHGRDWRGRWGRCRTHTAEVKGASGSCVYGSCGAEDVAEKVNARAAWLRGPSR